nr:PREDICTED: carboxypeptidase B-like [Bemisia tabaci]
MIRAALWLFVGVASLVLVCVCAEEKAQDGRDVPPGVNHADHLENDSTGAQILSVVIRGVADRKNFEEIRKEIYLDVLTTSKWAVDILVQKSSLDYTKHLLKSADLEFKVLIEDIQKQMEAENPPESKESLSRSSLRGHGLTFDRYHSVDTMYQYMEYLNRTYSDFVKLEDIGTSAEGRTLRVLYISSGQPNRKAIWIDGGIHAREWVASAAVLWVLSELTEKRERLPEEMRELDFVVMPMVNPDGYEYTRARRSTRLWRKNRAPVSSACAGVDVNRNFEHGWGGHGTSGEACRDTYRGPRPASERETQAIVSYAAKNIPKIQGFLTFHCYGQYILYPWGYDKILPEDHADLQRVGEIAAQRIKEVGDVNYTVGSSANLLYPAAGGSDDWAKSKGVKYAYTVELRGPGYPGGLNSFFLPPEQIIPSGKDAFEIVRTVAEAIVLQPS